MSRRTSIDIRIQRTTTTTTTAATTSNDWMLRSACRHTTDLEVFYPTHQDRANTQAAKAICYPCPVRTTCLEHALTTGETRGIWGGLTPHERQHLHEKTATS